jgi:hypothetical protein
LSVDVDQWFAARVGNGEATILLKRLVAGGYLTATGEPTRVGINAANAMLGLIEKNRPGVTLQGSMVDVLQHAEEVLDELDPSVPRDQRLSTLLLFGLVTESVTEQHHARIDFGRRVGRKIS